MSGSSRARSRKKARAIVQELLEQGIAEISEGLPVVKIDEKLGLTERDLPHHADPPLGWHDRSTRPRIWR